MASVMLNSKCMRIFFILNLYIYVSAENINGNPDWKLPLLKIDDLQKMVRVQEERISMLENQSLESVTQTVAELHNTVKKQGTKIAQLEARIQELETVVKIEDVIPAESAENYHSPLSETNGTYVSPNKTSNRRGKRLQSLQPTRMPVDMVAFYAYLSSDTPASVAHHIITFDTVITNVGNAYHPHSGTFIAPRSGLYVFTWTIRLYGNSYFTTELLVNNNVVNWIYFDPAHTIDGCVSGTAVVHVNQGDDVLIRTGPDYHNGNIISDKSGKSSFAGWIVM